MREDRLYMRGRGLYTERSFSWVWVSLNEGGKVIHEKKGLMYMQMEVCAQLAD